MSRIYKKSGGYRRLHSFNLATIVNIGVRRFCKRFINWKEDPLGKTVGQMVGAARSGKQNIIEGSERSKTSAETEIKLTDVSKASLAELQGDLEDYLIDCDSIPWSIHSPDHKEISAITLDQFEYKDDVLHDYWTFLLEQKRKYDPWLTHDDPTVVVNALIIMTRRAQALLERQLEKLESNFVEEGGIRERMSNARSQVRDADAPTCPHCDKPMRKRNGSKGEFWGCSGYPDCRGTREV